jgi:hypothetical protein
MKNKRCLGQRKWTLMTPSKLSVAACDCYFVHVLFYCTWLTCYFVHSVMCYFNTRFSCVILVHSVHGLFQCTLFTCYLSARCSRVISVHAVHVLF